MSSSNSTQRPTRNRLGKAISSALILAVAAPQLAAQNRLPDLGSETPVSRSAENDRLLGEALAFLSSGASTDALTDRAANAALQAGTDALHDAGVPFLGSLQGGVVYNSTLGQVDFDLLSMLPLSGEGPGSHWLLQLGAHNLRDRATANAGLVYRWLDPEEKYLVGGNVFYDHDFTAGVSRVGAGVEAANETLRAFGNAYAPLSGWVDSPDSAERQERAARGFDLGFAWTPRELSMLDLQFKGSKWLGDAVDVFGSGQTEIDPTVWSAKATLTPVQALRLGLEHSQVSGGQSDLQAMLSWVYQFGVPLAQQWSTNSGSRNDLRLRALSPVEREKRIIMETRDKFSTPVFANDAVVASVVEGQAFTHALNVAGGTLPLAFSLSGPDAARFTLSGTTLTLPAQQFDAPADAGADNTYNVTVVAVDARGKQATQQLAISVQSAAPVVSNARIVGSAQVGSALTLGYDFHSPLDEAEDTQGGSIQWFRRTEVQTRAATGGDIDIEGATGAQYVPTDDDVGHVIGARVGVRSASGRTSATVEVLGGVVKAAPGAGGNAPTANPSLQGAIAIGSTLTGLVGYADIDGDAEGTHVYQWYRTNNAEGTDSIGIVGATSSTYVIDAADVEHYLVFEVTPMSATGTPDVGAPARVVTRIAVPKPLVGSAPTASPTLQGMAKVGATLTGDVGYADADDDAPGAHVYRWYRATDAAGTQRTLIAGATGASYTAVSDDVGKYLVFEVVPRSATGTPAIGDAASVVSGQVADDGVPTANPTVSLAGARVVGNAVLTASAGFADADDDAEGTHLYQWYQADDAAGTNRVAIANATSATYMPVAADQGKHLVVQVTPKDARGVTGTATFSNNGVAMPYGEWRTQNVPGGQFTHLDIPVMGLSGTPARFRIEIGRADDGNPEAQAWEATYRVPGDSSNWSLTPEVDEIANGETWSRTIDWSPAVHTATNGTWRVTLVPYGGDGVVDYATIEFLYDQ